MLPVETPFKVFAGRDGAPLDRGFVYFGMPNQNPITSPVTVYWDADGTQPAAQPLRTVNGYIMRAGTPANVFYDDAYSQLVLDMNGQQVFYARSSDEFSIAAAIAEFLASIQATDGASLIGYIQAGVGATERTVLAKLRERVSVFDFMTAAQITDVQTSSFQLDCTVAIQKAINYAASIKATLYVPGGLYKVVPATVFDDEDGTYITLAAFIMTSDMHIEAAPGATFKIADNVSTDAAPQSMGMFCTNAVLSNVSLRNLRMDMNGVTNPISPLRPVTYNRYNQSPILVSGTPGGIAARIDDCTIEYCEFVNNPGVCDIVCAQSNVPGTILGKRWRMAYNKFIDNGLDTDDHTAVFAWMDDALFLGNEFSQTLKFAQVGRTGGNTCYEIHGSRHRLVGNNFRDYYRGVWVSSNLTDAQTRDSIIADNNFSTIFYGVDFFRSTATLSQPRNTIIACNNFRFDSYTFPPPVPQQRSAVQLASEYAQDGVLIVCNQAVSTDTVVGAAFLTVTPQTIAGQAHTNIVCKGNVARGFVNGALVRTNATNGLGYVALIDNEWVEPIPTAVFAVPIGVFIDPVGPIKTLILERNCVIDDRAVPLAQYGTYIQVGTINDLSYVGGLCKGLVSAEYLETGTVTGKKHGVFEVNGFTPVFSGGGVAFTVVDGVTQGRYRINGKQVTYMFEYTIGPGDTVPAGVLEVTIPLPAGASGSTWFGNWRIYDVITGNFTLGTLTVDGTASKASFARDGMTNISTAAPVALDTDDVIGGQVTYDQL